MNLSEPVRAALIGATVTVVMSLLQLFVNARRQAVERAAGKPASRKPGNWLAIFALMLACTVGGYAFSEYQGFRQRSDERLLREELQQRVRDIGAMAVRLEKAALQPGTQDHAEARLAYERRRGLEGVAAVVDLPACSPVQADAEGGLPTCADDRAAHASVCAVVPAGATVGPIEFFIRRADVQGAWAANRVQAEQEVEGAHFTGAHVERPAEAGTKEVCATLAHRGAGQARSARILVRYAP